MKKEKAYCTLSFKGKLTPSPCTVIGVPACTVMTSIPTFD